MLELVSKHFVFSSFRGVDFNGPTVGLANTKAMCTSSSGAVNEVGTVFCLTKGINVTFLALCNIHFSFTLLRFCILYIQDHNSNAIGVASTVAHEMGHNLGLSHDTENCVCGFSKSKKGCIMAESVG